jgi:GT2 family glycosyltransferase
MAAPRVTVAVLNYDGRKLLDVVMPSVLAQTYSRARVVVVDNGSRDGSGEYVEAHWPSVDVIRIAGNVGVAAALNRAIAATTGEFIALLNNDIELESRWLGELVAALDAHPGAASASGKLLRYHDRPIIDAAGDLMLWSGAVVNRGGGEPDRGQFDQAQGIFAACAGAALYRRTAFDVVGPFDESFFAYLEDIDWGVRAQLLAFGSRYVPTAVAYHIGGATTSRQKSFYVRLQRRNQVLLIIKNYPAEALPRHGWKIVINQLLTLAASARDRMLLAHLRGLGDALLQVRATMQLRKTIQRSRRVSASELDAVILASSPPLESLPWRLLYELAPLTMTRHRVSRMQSRCEETDK